MKLAFDGIIASGARAVSDGTAAFDAMVAAGVRNVSGATEQPVA